MRLTICVAAMQQDMNICHLTNLYTFARQAMPYTMLDKGEYN